jgi:hypothetical protein
MKNVEKQKQHGSRTNTAGHGNVRHWWATRTRGSAAAIRCFHSQLGRSALRPGPSPLFSDRFNALSPVALPPFHRSCRGVAQRRRVNGPHRTVSGQNAMDNSIPSQES